MFIEAELGCLIEKINLTEIDVQEGMGSLKNSIASLKLKCVLHIRGGASLSFHGFVCFWLRCSRRDSCASNPVGGKLGHNTLGGSTAEEID